MRTGRALEFFHAGRRPRRHGVLLRLSCVLLAGVLVSACSDEVRIRRTEFGIAHIEAPDLRSLAFGMAYAHARDHLCQTADHLLTMRGERSKHFGPHETGYFGLKQWHNRHLDVFVKAFMIKWPPGTPGRPEGMSRDAWELAQGYVAGYNDFLRTAAARNDNTVQAHYADCLGPAAPAPAEDMTIEQFLRLNEEISIMLGSGGLIDAIVDADGASFGWSDPSRSTTTHGTTDDCIPAGPTASLAPMTPQAGVGGSNGWAFGREATGNRRGLVLGNPHFPWEGPLRFWQVHLKTGGLDVMGVAMGNSPIVQIGYNRDVAWTHTVATNKSHVVYRLALERGDRRTYLSDGKPHRMEAVPVTISVRTPGGQTVECVKTVWRTRYGPIVTKGPHDWTDDFAYAVKDANLNNLRAIDTWLNIGRASTVGEIERALSNLGLQWSNTIAADRHGTALFASHSATPHITDAQLQRCEIKAAVVDQSLRWNPVLDGSTSACDWMHDRRSPVRGLIAPGRLPAMVATDYVLNSNDSFWLTQPQRPLTGYPRIVGWTDSVQLLRTRAGIEQAQSLVRKPGSLDDSTLRNEFFSNRNHAARLVLDDLLGLCTFVKAGDTTLIDACTTLRNWDRTSDANKPGALLFREFWKKLNSRFNHAPPWRVPFDPNRPVDTPRGLLGFSDMAVRKQVLDALSDAAAGLPSGTSATLGAVQKHSVRGTSYELHGGPEYEGVLNKLVCTKQKCGEYGPTYLQVVTFDRRGPVARSLLVYGQSSNPASEHYFDQLPNYAGKTWVDAPFHDTDIETSTVRAKQAPGADPKRYETLTLPRPR